jgi:putative restriction endonuclease
MFDRGLISIDDDHSILIAEDRIPADTVERLIVPERRLLLPDNPRALPHPAYLKYHREVVFKG